jgi:hypothetical protein
MYSMSILARVIQPADAILCQNFLQENRLDAGRFKGFPGVMALFGAEHERASERGKR